METTTIRKLFSDQDRKFKIPAYQRAYSWEKEHILQFIQDLKDATKSYYLGHFLFEQDDERDKMAANTLLIIDGQQRLTTCLIFFSVLYHELFKRRTSGEKVNVDIDDIAHFYLRDTRKKIQKFETVPDDNNFFVDEIIDRGPGIRHKPTTSSQKRILEARKLFEDACSVESKVSLVELERWYELVTQATCTEFRIEDKVKAAQIFAFQNDRGKSLSKLEVLKSFFMLQLYLRSETANAMTEHLNYLQKDISLIYNQIVKVTVDEDDVLLYYWRACDNSKGFDSRDTVKEIKECMTELPKDQVCIWIKSFISGLAKTFQLVEEVENSHNRDIKHLMCLDNMALSYPFLIRAYLHGATTCQLERLATLLENITFRFLVRGGRAEIQSRLNQLLELDADNNYVEVVISGAIDNLRNNPWWGYWSDATVAQYLDGWMYGNRVDNYLLWRYEVHLCSTTGYPLSLKVGFRDLIAQESIDWTVVRSCSLFQPKNIGVATAGQADFGCEKFLEGNAFG